MLAAKTCPCGRWRGRGGGVEQQGELQSAAYAKSGGRRSHGAWELPTARQRQRGAENIARHSPRCPTGSRNSTERREDVHSKRHDVDVQGAVKPARAIARGEASPQGLSIEVRRSRERAPRDHQRWHAVPNTVSSTSLFGMTWSVLSTKRCSPNR